jgi:hypothetical protein
MVGSNLVDSQRILAEEADLVDSDPLSTLVSCVPAVNGVGTAVAKDYVIPEAHHST